MYIFSACYVSAAVLNIENSPAYMMVNSFSLKKMTKGQKCRGENNGAEYDHAEHLNLVRFLWHKEFRELSYHEILEQIIIIIIINTLFL